MCGGSNTPPTKAEWIDRTNHPEVSGWSLVGTYYNESGESVVIVTDNDTPYAEWVRAIYSEDGKERENYEQEGSTDDVRARAIENAAGRGYTFTEDPTKIARKARAARKSRPQIVHTVVVDNTSTVEDLVIVSQIS